MVFGNTAAVEGLLHLTDDESETKFDNLVSATNLNLEANLLTRVPSLKNMRRLLTLYLESNKITRVAPGKLRVSRNPFIAGWPPVYAVPCAHG